MHIYFTNVHNLCIKVFREEIKEVGYADKILENAGRNIVFRYQKPQFLQLYQCFCH